MPGPHGRRMKMAFKSVICVCLAAICVPGAARAASVLDMHQSARGAQSVSVREIERRVIPQMRGAQYLGFDYDPSTNIYTLKFLRNGSVIWVDVEGRTGSIVRRSGN